MMQILIACLLYGLTLSAVADTVITNIPDEEGSSRTSIQNNWVRMDTGNAPEFMLWDLKTGNTYIINHEERHIIDFIAGKEPASDQQTPPVDIKVVKKGEGPAIAGYSTTEYTVSANGEYCGQEFFSSSASKNKDIHYLASKMDSLIDLESQMPDVVGSVMKHNEEPCDQAEIAIAEKMKAHGMSLKSIESDGEVSFEVAQIDTKTKLDSALFTMPEDYKHMTMKEVMGEAVNDAMKKMEDMLKEMPPEGQDFMKKLLQFGQPPKE